MTTKRTTVLDQEINDYLLTASGHLKENKSAVDGKQVAAYGIATSSALVMMSQAEAAVVHNAGFISPVTAVQSSIPTGTTYAPFDINNDGVNDFAVFAAFDSPSSYSAGLNGTPGAASNSVLGIDDVYKLASGVQIGPTPPGGLTWQPAPSTVRDVFSETGGVSNWSGSANETGLAGVRFRIGSQTHYGWIRLRIDSLSDPVQLSATEWAYESCPNTPINAGQTTGGLVTCPAPAAIPVMGAAGYGLSTLALGALGLASLRRRREKRGAEEPRQ